MKLGPIDVPEVTTEGVFPLRPDWGWSHVIEPQVAVHTFESGNRKVEQRFYLGDGARRYVLRFDSLRPSQIDTLRAFWEDHSGAYGQFYFDAPISSGAGTRRVVCRFAEPALSISHVADLIASVGVTLIEVPEAPPSYAVDSTINRYPDGAFEQHLAAPVQTLVPLLDIVTHESKTEPSHALHLSDRYCTLGGTLYQARLLDWDGISQSIGNDSDVARFVLANADRVLKLLSDQVALDNAQVQFSAYHVQTAARIDIWGGCLARWVAKGATFEITVQDGIFELLQKYPRRRAAHTCWKRFKSYACAYQGDDEACDKTFATCTRLANQNRFGGIMLQPQPVTTRDNSQSGRPRMTTTTIIADTIYDLPIPEVYTDREMIVPAILAGFREEGDFASGLGVVSEGPIGGYASPLRQYLDGAPPHGPGNLGWRGVIGNDPQAAPFGLSHAGPGNVWIYPNSTTAAGTAFVEIRKKDASGLQLSRIGDHQITVAITAGVGGWVWDDPLDANSRRWAAPLTNPAWVMVNVLLRARALHYAEIDPAEQVGQFDLAACHATAAICDLEVPCIIDRTPRIWVPTDTSGNGYWDSGSQQTTETQFVFCGRLGEEKPLRDWLTEIAQGALLYFTFRNNKLRIGIRSNATPVQAFGPGNIVADSLQVEPIDPDYNHLTVRFGNCDNNWELSNVDLYDEDQAWRLGSGNIEVKKSAQMNLVGCPTPSQAARVCIGRLRETLGGVIETEQVKARRLQFASTVISLAVDPGMCCSLTHEELPDSRAVFRVQHWRLRKDWGIDYSGSTVAESCYEYMTGPRPAAVTYTPGAGDPNGVPSEWSFDLVVPGDGTVRIGRLICKRGAARVRQASFDILTIDETTSGYTRVIGGIPDAEGEGPFGYQGVVPRVGQLLYCGGEILEVTRVVPSYESGAVAGWLDTGEFYARRGRGGSQAAVHARLAAIATEVDRDAVLTVAALGWRLGDTLIAPTQDPNVGDVRYIAGIEADGTRLTVERAYDQIAPGDEVYSDPRLYRCEITTEVLTIDASFWTSGKAATWERTLALPNRSLVAVRGQLASHNYLTPYLEQATGRLRTLGNQRFEFVHPAVPSGRMVDAFVDATVPVATAFSAIWAEALPWAGSGSILLDGTLEAESSITVTLEPIGPMPVLEYGNIVPAAETLSDAARALAAHLNAQAEFAAEYFATAEWAYCFIQSIRGASGAVLASCSGGLTATTADVVAEVMAIPTPPSVAAVTPGAHQRTALLRVWAGLVGDPATWIDGVANNENAVIPLDLAEDCQFGVVVSDVSAGTHVETAAPFRFGDHLPLVTAGDLGRAICQWLNSDPVFGAHYRCEMDGNQSGVWIIDPLGNPGTIGVAAANNVLPSGFGVQIATEFNVTNQLGVRAPGRRYATTWAGSGQESAPSALSAPSGATGSAVRIELQGLPECPLSWVDTIHVYAAFVVGDSCGLYRVASVPAGESSAIDEAPEFSLTSKPRYSGVRDQTEGAVTIQVKVNGRPWLDLRTGSGETRSNLIDGLAAGNLGAGATIQVDLDSTDHNLRNVRVVME
jgi:hypothetical protein